MTLFLLWLLFLAFSCHAYQATNPVSGAMQLLKQRSTERLLKTTTNRHVRILRASSSVDPIAVVGNAKTGGQYIDQGSRPPYTLSKQQFLYVVLTSIFITCLIVADVIGVKLFEFKLPFKIFGFDSVEHTCGMITFPITFLLGDIINEYYVSFLSCLRTQPNT
jgi:hypothetical protein